MRTFFALDLTPKLKVDIDQWRSKSLPAAERKIPMVNFHITLCFNGKTDQFQLDELQSQAANITVKQFDLKLDEFGFFSKPGIAFIGCRHIPDELSELNKKLENISQQLGLSTERRPYTPHVTLFRRLSTPPPSPLLAPEFDMHVDSFTLFESVSLKQGVKYQPMFNWELERNWRPTTRR